MLECRRVRWSSRQGTGIGKTLAYLVPAILSGQRVIISTGTKTLQDQLFFRDLPMVRETALGESIKPALLKGSAPTTLCLHRMTLARTDGTPAQPRGSRGARGRHGLVGTERSMGTSPWLRTSAEESGLLPLVTSTADNCLGSECPQFDDCHVARARREAQDADIVVVNHHLLFADMAIKQTGFGEVLPGAALPS